MAKRKRIGAEDLISQAVSQVRKATGSDTEESFERAVKRAEEVIAETLQNPLLLGDGELPLYTRHALTRLYVASVAATEELLEAIRTAAAQNLIPPRDLVENAKILQELMASVQRGLGEEAKPSAAPKTEAELDRRLQEAERRAALQ